MQFSQGVSDWEQLVGWALQRKGKRCRAGGRLPPLHSISPLCQWDFLLRFSAGQTPQTHRPEPREGVFQRLSSQPKLNLTTQPTLQARHSSSPSPVTPPTFRQMEPDTLSHPSVLTRARREEGNCKTDNGAFKALGVKMVPGR